MRLACYIDVLKCSLPVYKKLLAVNTTKVKVNVMAVNKKAEVNSQIADELMATASEMEGKYLTFWTDKQLYGVPIAHVVQIVGMQEVTEIPEFPDYAKGVINLRGSIIPVVDVRLRLHKPESVYSERTCIIVTNINNTSVGFIVDEVDEVTEISEDMVSPPPKVSTEVTNSYLTGVGKLDKCVVLLFDTAKLISEDALELLSSAAVE